MLDVPFSYPYFHLFLLIDKQVFDLNKSNVALMNLLLYVCIGMYT